jgi:riboflavin synthase
MFTGIVTDVGQIAATERPGDLRATIATAYDTGGVDLGASIACSGVCLTVVDKGPGWFAVDVSGETERRTAAGAWEPGRRLNLERALRLGDELGGHIVTGHVDGVGRIASVTPEGESKRIVIHAPPEIAPFVAPKGSITIDGVSLTVNDVADRPDGSTRFAINLIPHTQAVTTLGALEADAQVHLEIDVLARYLQRMEQLRAKAG